MDIVVEGLDESKSVTIISGEHEEISEAIMDRLGRNTTLIYAKGGYTKEDTQMIYCVRDPARGRQIEKRSFTRSIRRRSSPSRTWRTCWAATIEKKSIH